MDALGGESSQDSEAQIARGVLPGDRYMRRHYGRPRRGTSRLAALFSLGYINVGSSIYYAPGVIALFALGAAPLALAIASLVFALTALTYVEMTVAIPEAEGSPSFVRRGLNEFFGAMVGWLTILNYLVTIAISASIAVAYLAVFLPSLEHGPGHLMAAVGLIAALAVFNIFGGHEGRPAIVAVAALDMVLKVLLVLLGGIFLFKVPTLVHQVHWGTAPSSSGFIYGIAIAVVAYTGLGTVTNLAHEAKDPSPLLPRAYGLLIAVVMTLFIAITVIGLSAMPVHQASTAIPSLGVKAGGWSTALSAEHITSPIAGIAQQLPSPLNSLVGGGVGVLAFLTLAMAANAGLRGVCRRYHRMALYRQVPMAPARVHARLRTPVIAILLFGALAATMTLPGRFIFLIDLYAFSVALTFAFAHASLVALRWRDPMLARPFRLPLNLRLRGRSIPILAVLGGLGSLTMWGVILASRSDGRWFGLGWLGASLIAYLVYRRRAGLPLTTTVRRGQRTE